MTSRLFARNITIDINPDLPSPYINIQVNKAILNDDGSLFQCIGNFDRITKPLHTIAPIPLSAFHIDDGDVDAHDLFHIIGGFVYQWIQAKHGGVIEHDGVMVD